MIRNDPEGLLSFAGAGMEGEGYRGRPGVEEESATPWVWRSSLSEGEAVPLSESFFSRATERVARGLLGCRLRSISGGVGVEGVIVETEAYVGPHDPASHAAASIGRTKRNLAMFGPPGRAYIYRSYGIHWCLNAVTREEGFPAAVLLRAVDPLAGMAQMRRRRGGKEPLCSGPGRLGQAFGISGDLDGYSMTRGSLVLLEGWQIPETRIGVSSRIGISKAKDLQLRFYVRGHPEVSGRPR